MYVLTIGSTYFCADPIHEFEHYAVMPYEETPYARHITLADFVNKLVFYYSKALEVVRNVGAGEDGGI
jgi:hypothetical protein